MKFAAALVFTRCYLSVSDCPSQRERETWQEPKTRRDAVFHQAIRWRCVQLLRRKRRGFVRGGTWGWSCAPGRSAPRRPGRNMSVVVGGCAAYHINKPPRCIILQPPGLDRCPEQRDWKSFESGLHCRTCVEWKLPTAQPLNTNQATKATGWKRREMLRGNSFKSR